MIRINLLPIKETERALGRRQQMSLVALGPDTQVSGRPSATDAARRATASGTSVTTWSARTTHTCRSGTRVSARRPWSGRWSSTNVPVSAIPTAAAVTTASTRLSSSWDRAGSSDSTSRPDASTAARHAASMPTGFITATISGIGSSGRGMMVSGAKE